MTKSLSSYPEAQRRAIITRRLAQGTRGAGYWSARSAAEKLGIAIPEKHAPRKQRPENERPKRREHKRQGGGVKLRDLLKV